MTLFNVVDEREKGTIPISIGTALAIEAAQGTYPDRPVVSPAPILSTKLLFVNLRTLYRNLIGCIATEARAQVTAEHLAPALLEEMHILNALIPEISEGNCDVSFYVSEYAQVKTEFKGALLKEPHTPKQLAQRDLETATFELLRTKSLPENVHAFKGVITGRYPRTFILTHYVVDLLNRYAFEKLELLESHTGAIKPYAMWGTKLSSPADASIPLMDFTLKVFGDGTHFTGQRPTVKKALLEQALIDKWTGLSTLSLVRNSVSKISDPDVKRELQALL